MLSSTFEGGTDNTPVTTANSGGNSGNPFDSIFRSGSGQVLYSAASAIHGGLGALTSLSGNTASAVAWSSSFGSPASFWVRDYLTIGSLPAGTYYVSGAVGGFVAPLWNVAVTPSGHIGIWNAQASSFPSGGLSASVLSPSSPCRYELAAAFSAGSWTVTLRLFTGSNADGSIPNETLAPSPMSLGAAQGYLFGAMSPAPAAWAVAHDDIALSTDGWIGPYQALAPGLSRSRSPRSLPHGQVIRSARHYLWRHLGQANQGVRFPLLTRQPGYHPRWAPYLRRGHQFAPVPPPQVVIPSPLVLAHRGSGPRHWAPYLRRGRQFAPVPAQASQGTPFPLITRGQPGYRPRWAPKLRRGAFFFKRLPQDPQGSPFNLFTRQPGRFPRWAPPRRYLHGRIASPPWPQRPPGVRFPLVTRRQDAMLTRSARTRRSARISQVPLPRLTMRASASLSATGTLSAVPVVTRLPGARLTAQATLSASPVVTRPATVSLEAPATLRARASLLRVASASLSAPAALTAPGTVTKLASAAMSATGTLTASAGLTSAARLSAPATMTALASARQLASASLGASGALLASAQVSPPLQEILVDGSKIAPWDQVMETGAWQRQAPADDPAIITTPATITGTYDQVTSRERISPG